MCLVLLPCLLPATRGVEDVAGEWGEFGAWSDCSVQFTCQRGGVRKRSIFSNHCTATSPLHYMRGGKYLAQNGSKAL